MSDIRPDEKEALSRECEAIGRYLTGRSPSSDLVGRYVRAHAVVLSGPTEPPDRAVIEFVRRHPWTLPYLDAVSALLRPSGLLRSKILLTVALLEAAPEFTAFFFPDVVSVPRFFFRMARHGISSAAKFLIGCAVYPFAAGGR